MSVEPNPARTLVTAAVTIVLVLGGLLGARALVHWKDRAAEATEAPASRAETARGVPGALKLPQWSYPRSATWPVEFQTDLDLLAPLGDGSDNAASWFVLFEKERGPRAADAEAADARRVEAGEDFGWALEGDDELLLEAEPWVDQAIMSFYPAMLPLEGVNTRFPNLRFMMTLARSWAARGVASHDPLDGLEDCRRAIRLGRLLRQEDVTIINDIVGLHCIDVGARCVYRLARQDDDLELALLASVVIGEIAPQRSLTAKRTSDFDLSPFLFRESSGGRFVLELPDAKLDEMIETARSFSQRRFMGEVYLTFGVVHSYGTAAQRETVRSYLGELAVNEDPIIAEGARGALESTPSEENLEMYYPHPMER